MPDVWPYGPPNRIDWHAVYNYLRAYPVDQTRASILTAIGYAESNLDLHVVNDTPGTGDLSIGAWQVNYFDGLYAGRAAAFGTPQQLVQGGLAAQAYAAIVISDQDGYTPWSTYKSGAYKAYLNGPVPGQAAAGGQASGLGIPTDLNNDSWHGWITQAGEYMHAMSYTSWAYARAIADI